MGRTCVVGAEALRVDHAAREFTTGDGVRVSEGDVISIDGGTGEVFLGEVPVVPSAVVGALQGDEPQGMSEVEAEVVSAVQRLMTRADERRRLGVRANADTPKMHSVPACSVPRGSVCAAPSTCSSGIAGRSSSG